MVLRLIRMLANSRSAYYSRHRYAEFLRKKGSLIELEHVKTDSFEPIKGLGRGVSK